MILDLIGETIDKIENGVRAYNTMVNIISNGGSIRNIPLEQKVFRVAPGQFKSYVNSGGNMNDLL